MTGKQKRYLRSLASTMPVVLHIGKGGLEPAVIQSAEDAIRSRELIKVKVLQNCPLLPADVFPQLSEAIQAELVQVIGKNGVYYRPAKEPKIELPK